MYLNLNLIKNLENISEKISVMIRWIFHLLHKYGYWCCSKISFILGPCLIINMFIFNVTKLRSICVTCLCLSTNVIPNYVIEIGIFFVGLFLHILDFNWMNSCKIISSMKTPEASFLSKCKNFKIYINYLSKAV